MAESYLKCSHGLRLALLGGENFSLVNPALHADDAVRGARFGETVIDIRAQRMQRQAALQVPLRARDFVSVQASAHADLDSLASKTQRRVHRFTHRAAEANPLFQLQGNRL